MSENKSSCDCSRNIGCDVQNCMYHSKSENLCTAEHIRVENKSALNKAETYCSTFTAKTSF